MVNVCCLQWKSKPIKWLNYGYIQGKSDQHMQSNGFMTPPLQLFMPPLYLSQFWTTPTGTEMACTNAYFVPFLPEVQRETEE